MKIKLNCLTHPKKNVVWIVFTNYPTDFVPTSVQHRAKVQYLILISLLLVGWDLVFLGSVLDIFNSELAGVGPSIPIGYKTLY